MDEAAAARDGPKASSPVRGMRPGWPGRISMPVVRRLAYGVG